MGKRKTKGALAAEPAPRTDPEAELEIEPAPTDDGQAATAAEPVPPKRKRGRPKGSRSKPKADVPESESLNDALLDPELVKMAAIGPMLLAGAVGAKFLSTQLVYDPDQMASCQRIFGQWMDRMGATLHPGYQYAIMASITVGNGIMNSVPLTKEEKELMEEAARLQREAAKDAAVAQARAAVDEAHKASAANGAAQHSTSAPEAHPAD